MFPTFCINQLCKSWIFFLILLFLEIFLQKRPHFSTLGKKSLHKRVPCFSSVLIKDLAITKRTNLSASELVGFTFIAIFCVRILLPYVHSAKLLLFRGHEDRVVSSQ